MTYVVKCIFVLAFLGLSAESRVLVKRQTSSSTSTSSESMTPGELLQGIQELLGGAANVLGTIINIKKDTLDPVMDTIDRAGEFAVQLSVSNTKKKSKLENHNGWLCKERIA